jgi:hypothetical protein
MTRREPISLFRSDARRARRPHRRVRRVLVASCLAWSMVWSMSCNELVTDGNSASVLVLELLDGSPGTTDSFAGSLQSESFPGSNSSSGGTTSTPTATYNSAGTYVVTLTVTDSENRSGTTSEEVTVATP